VLAVRALADRIQSEGVPVPSDLNLPAEIRALPSDKWSETVYGADIIDRKAKRARQSASELKDALKVKNLIAERNGLLWLTSTL
jgi:hypothetical protein